MPKISLCTLGSEKYRDQNQKALDYSSREIEFGAVKNIIQECPTIDDWNKAIVFDLGNYIDTPFALLIHPDGFVVHPECWRDEWLEYDYIGSPWPFPSDFYSYRDFYGNIVRVGNSVSLRSKKLMTLPHKLKLQWRPYFGNTNEDGFVCCHMRHTLEAYGCEFAPLEEAIYFGREHEIPENKDIDKTFVFHRHWGRNKDFPNFE